jgi:acyl-CoA thioesterase I
LGSLKLGVLSAVLIWSVACNPGNTGKSRMLARTFDSGKAQESAPLILAFGDSLTAGLGVDPEENYPSRLQVLLESAGYPYRVLNQGVSGDTTSRALRRIESAVALKPDIVILELGINDGLQGISVLETRKNLDEMLSRFEAGGARTVLAGMLMPPVVGSDYTNSFAALYPELARKHGSVLIPFFLRGVAGRRGLNLPDGLHPNAAGYEIITANVWKILQPLLR